MSFMASSCQVEVKDSEINSNFYILKLTHKFDSIFNIKVIFRINRATVICVHKFNFSSCTFTECPKIKDIKQINLDKRKPLCMKS